MARESRTKYAVLGMLNFGPKCGYEIKKELEQASMFFWNESYGQIYPMLKKLVHNELATLELVERDEQPDMKVYTITNSGRKELEHWLKKPAELYPVRNEMLLKLFFGASADQQTNSNHVKRLVESLHTQTHDFEAQREVYHEEEIEPEQLTYLLLTLRYGELVNQALQQWCQEAQQVLEPAE